MTNDTAIARREEAPLMLKPLEITSIAGRDDIERIETTVTLPAAFQYGIKVGRVKTPAGWVDKQKVGITADGYDYLNRSMGATFFLPDFVPDDNGEMVRNPIRRPDYLYLRMGIVYYNEVGQMVAYVEDLEVDYKHIYQTARLNSPGSEVVLDEETHQPIFDERNMPFVIINDHTATYDGKDKLTTAAEQERKALQAFQQLRTTGLRYAQTVLRVRLLKVALGVKSLPLNEPRDIRLKVVGYRDRMDPTTRVEEAKKKMGALYGRPPEEKPLTWAEMQAIEHDVVADDGEAEAAFTGGNAGPVEDEGEFYVPEEAPTE